MEPLQETLDQFATPEPFLHLQNFEELHRANMNRVFVDFETNPKSRSMLNPEIPCIKLKGK
jgi:hypothetical protein